MRQEVEDDGDTRVQGAKRDVTEKKWLKRACFSARVGDSMTTRAVEKIFVTRVTRAELGGPRKSLGLVEVHLGVLLGWMRVGLGDG